MKIGIAKERRAHELRVAVSPDTVKQLIGLGAEVAIETGAGLSAAYTDQSFADAGDNMATDEATAVGDAELVRKVQLPLGGADVGVDEMALVKPGAMLVGILSPYTAKDQVTEYARLGINAFAMEFMPRI